MDDFIISQLNLSREQIKEIKVLKINNTITYYLTLISRHSVCPYCGGTVITHGYKDKKIEHNLYVAHECIIIWHARRYRCKDCHTTFLEDNPFTFAGFTFSYATIQNIMLLLKNLNYSYKEIAIKNHISITQVQRYMDSFINFPRIRLPENIGIDEIHSSMALHNSSYLCILVDNNERVLIEILQSRSKSFLNNYFDLIPIEEKSRVKYVTIDMWEPYKDVALRQFPNCEIAVDPFHVIKHLTFQFTRIRLNIQNQVEPYGTTYYLLKHWHKLLESDKYNLDNEPQFNQHFKKKLNYRDLYNMLLDINETLTLAYHLKERFRDFIRKGTPENCSLWFEQLYQQFLEANIPEYREFLNTINNWKPEILNSFKRPYNNRKQSNALSENINNQIRGYLAVSNGNSNFKRFRKRLIYSLNHKVYYSINNSLTSDKRNFKPRGKYNK